MRQLRAIAKKAKCDEQTILMQALTMYGNYLGISRNKSPLTEKLALIEQDPDRRAIFSEVMSGIAKRTASAMTPAERTARARKAGLARSASMTPEQRSALARMGGLNSRKKGKD
jgi:hypothetical protein